MDIVFAIFHAPLEPVRALDDAVVLIHAFFELFELVIHKGLCGFCAAASGREGADQRDAAGNQGYDDGFCHSGVCVPFIFFDLIDQIAQPTSAIYCSCVTVIMGCRVWSRDLRDSQATEYRRGILLASAGRATPVCMSPNHL